jgi:SAM-dependent methyltransferase
LRSTINREDFSVASTSAANADVLAFYKELPFNYHGSAREHAKRIRSSNQLTGYPPLMPLLQRGTSLLDVACGVGWFSLSASYDNHCRVTGIDFNPIAIERAHQIGRVLGISAEFYTVDLFQFESGERYDVVASIGVLHHTNDCHAALQLCAIISSDPAATYSLDSLDSIIAMLGGRFSITSNK